MPPRRRTFYLADATLLSNVKVSRLRRTNPDEWLAAVGAFHILIGVATLNDDPTFTADDCLDILGDDAATILPVLRAVGLMDEDGLDPGTFEEWKPKPRPRYPSDYGGVLPDYQGVQHDSPVVGPDSDGEQRNSGEKSVMPTSTSSSSSSTDSASSSTSRGANGEWDGKVAATLARAKA